MVLLGLQCLRLQAEPIPGLPDAALGLVPVTAAGSSLLVDCLLNNRLLIISTEKYQIKKEL